MTAEDKQFQHAKSEHSGPLGPNYMLNVKAARLGWIKVARDKPLGFDNRLSEPVPMPESRVA